MDICGEEKNKAYIITAVDRLTHTIVDFSVCRERSLEIFQSVIDAAPKAENYFTDSFLMYQDLSYWGNHRMLKDKSETYSVEGTNADLRHYLARLQRSARCFSRCFKALSRAAGIIRLFLQRVTVKKKKTTKLSCFISRKLTNAYLVTPLFQIVLTKRAIIL